MNINGKAKDIDISKQRVYLIFFFTFIFVFSSFFLSAYAQPVAIPEGTHCDECGMMVDPHSKFASEVSAEKGRQLFFCDIGDMLYHFRTAKNTIRSVYVRDFPTGAWIDGRKAKYVLNKKFETPMEWGIAAFSSDSEAKKWGIPRDFHAAFALPSAILKERMK